ncbi:hypothetical protein LR48_Vigan10g064300 [Vigna angularis]|uniref:Uncharacterized protein n=1 Tax=Phaseolus angularis TaxID=3914 RepID=A0A0L9VI68_PHAAN|nr:hypothetical protein LR48_Vigan10g064300 [Vigna angularis]
MFVHTHGAVDGSGGGCLQHRQHPKHFKHFAIRTKKSQWCLHRSPTNQLPNTLGTQNPFRNPNPCIPKGNQTLIPGEACTFLLSHGETIRPIPHFALLPFLQIVKCEACQSLPPRRLTVPGNADGTSDPRSLLALLNDFVLTGNERRRPHSTISGNSSDNDEARGEGRRA